MSTPKLKYYFLSFILFIFILIIYLMVFISTSYLVYESAGKDLDIYLNKNGMEKRPGKASGEYILESPIIGGHRVKLFITAWKKETPEERYYYSFTMERSWFFGNWKVLTFEKEGKATNWPGTSK